MKYAQVPRRFKNLDLNTSNQSTLSTGENYIVELSDKYDIYDYAEITNLNSNSDAIIILNGSIKRPLPKGTQAIINTKFRSIEIINNGSSDILANELQVNYSHISKEKDFLNKSFALAGMSRWF